MLDFPVPDSHRLRLMAFSCCPLGSQPFCPLCWYSAKPRALLGLAGLLCDSACSVWTRNKGLWIGEAACPTQLLPAPLIAPVG